MPDNDQEHVNPQRVQIGDLREHHIAEMIAQIQSFQTKKRMSITIALQKYSGLISQILKDFEECPLTQHSQINPPNLADIIIDFVPDSLAGSNEIAFVPDKYKS